MFLRKHFVEGGGTLTELEDICQNLTNVLRTKRACGYFIQPFGLTEAGYSTPEEMVTKLTAEITENVRLFEPRVALIDIDEEYSDAGERAKLIVNLKMRSASEKVAIVVDLATNTLDVHAVKPRTSKSK